MEIFLGIIGIIACLAGVFYTGVVWCLASLSRAMSGSNAHWLETTACWVLPFVGIGLIYLIHRILVFLYH